jgi:hypothetical protein
VRLEGLGELKKKSNELNGIRRQCVVTLKRWLTVDGLHRALFQKTKLFKWLFDLQVFRKQRGNGRFKRCAGFEFN